MPTNNDPQPASPPFYHIPNLSNLRDPALLPLHTRTEALIRRGRLFRSADVSEVDEDGWCRLRELGVNRVFDLRSGPELARGHAHSQGTSNDKSKHDIEKGGEEKDTQGHESEPIDGGNTEDTTTSTATAATQNNTSPSISTPATLPKWQQAMQAAGISRQWVPVFQSADYSPARLAERYMCYMDEDASGFVRAYEDILRNAGPAFRQIFIYLASLPAPTSSGTNSSSPGVKASENFKTAEQNQTNEKNEDYDDDGKKGILVHCSAGKDRTGIFFGLLFSFLDVPRELIAEEYHQTEHALQHMREQIVPRLLKSEAFKGHMKGLMDADKEGEVSKSKEGDAVREGDVVKKGNVRTGKDENLEDVFPPAILARGREAAVRMVSARKESMLGALEMLDRVFGGAEAYMRRECGLGDEELEGLRRNLVVGYVS